MLRASSAKGRRWRSVLAGKSLKPGVEGQMRDRTMTNTYDDQTQFRTTATELEVHPCLSRRVSEVGRKTRPTRRPRFEFGARKSTRRDDGKPHNLRKNKDGSWPKLCDNLAPEVLARTSGLRYNEELRSLEDSWKFRSGTSALQDSGILRKMDGRRVT